ncbi:hypothetical protein [Caldilinea sp.]|uniref:hypothetical protein n=1 Tax=Caldilinea sp. TaxID=2293560 RepID=UPI0025849368|nr:hypothetical protein [Caldilinea sp.]
MGIVIGLLLGAVATIPGHLVLLATLRRQQGQELPWLKTWEATGPRPGHTRRRAGNAPAIYLLPVERRAATPTAPPDTLGAWYSPGPGAYDLEWNDPPVATSDGP